MVIASSSCARLSFLDILFALFAAPSDPSRILNSCCPSFLAVLLAGRSVSSSHSFSAFLLFPPRTQGRCNSPTALQGTIRTKGVSEVCGGMADLNSNDGGCPRAEMTGIPRYSTPSARARSNVMLGHPIGSQPCERAIAMGAYQRASASMSPYKIGGPTSLPRGIIKIYEFVGHSFPSTSRGHMPQR